MVQTTGTGLATVSAPSPFAQTSTRARGGRYNKDKFGVRRYRRYLNKVWLLQDAVDNRDDLEEEDLSPFDNTPSQFSTMFTDILTWNLLLPFADCTEEEEEVLYLTLQEKNQQQGNNNNSAPVKRTIKERMLKENATHTKMLKANKRFCHLDKKVQNFCEDRAHLKFIQQFEEQIIQICDGESLQWSELDLEDSNDPFERFICHGICQYYGVTSNSQKSKSGKAFMIKKPERFNLPAIKLSTFLYLKGPSSQ